MNDKIFVGAHLEPRVYEAVVHAVAKSQLGELSPIFSSRADFIRHAIIHYLGGLKLGDFTDRMPSDTLKVVRNV